MTDTTAAAARPTRRPTTTGKPRRRRNVLASDEPQDLSPVLAGVYIRVSTAREEMISPELQQRDVDAYLARMTAQTGRPWRAVVVEQDLDVSGRSFAREGIQKLMGLMREGVISTIVTYRYDRFGRNLQQALTHLDEVEASVDRSSASPSRSTPPPPSAVHALPVAVPGAAAVAADR